MWTGRNALVARGRASRSSSATTPSYWTASGTPLVPSGLAAHPQGGHGVWRERMLHRPSPLGPSRRPLEHGPEWARRCGYVALEAIRIPIDGAVGSNGVPDGAWPDDVGGRRTGHRGSGTAGPRPADHETFRSGVRRFRPGSGDLMNCEWSLPEPHLPPSAGRGGRWRDHRTVINGIMFRVRTGVPWRDLPDRYVVPGRPSRKGIAAGRRTEPGTGACAPPRLTPISADGSTAAWSAWTRPRAGPTSTQPVPRKPHLGSRKRTTPRHHRTDEGLGRSRGGVT